MVFAFCGTSTLFCTVAAPQRQAPAAQPPTAPTFCAAVLWGWDVTQHTLNTQHVSHTHAAHTYSCHTHTFPVRMRVGTHPHIGARRGTSPWSPVSPALQDPGFGFPPAQEAEK